MESFECHFTELSNHIIYFVPHLIILVIYQQQYMQATTQSIIQSSLKRLFVLVLTNISFSLYFHHMDKFLNIFRFNEPSINIEQALQILLFNMLHYQLYSTILRTRFLYQHYSVYILSSAIMRFVYYVYFKRYIQNLWANFYMALGYLKLEIEVAIYFIIFIMAIVAIFYLQKQRNSQKKRGKLILLSKSNQQQLNLD